MKLMTKVKVLSSELKTLQSQQRGKDAAVDDLRDFVAQVANKAGVTGHSITRAGDNVNTAEELAKELVNSKIQISELKRKLRVASRVGGREDAAGGPDRGHREDAPRGREQ